MQHLAATVPGELLSATASVTAVESHSIQFDVVVTDGTGEVAAAGEHGRCIIDVARLHRRLASKGRAVGSTTDPIAHVEWQTTLALLARQEHSQALRNDEPVVPVLETAAK